ncbi:MAG: RIP metalloprotease RseP [Candidatus Moranbacteria bacterium]|nr:RIP metalloprotease RseP [Candidatus Moranbacteria bacterium]
MATVLIFLLVLGLLVFVHEMGHFIVARRNGIKADEFGFGFPPRLAGFVWDDEKKKHRFVKGNEEVVSPHTVYSLNWIPLGGFVKIKGEDGVQKDPDSFAIKSAWVRIKVLAAGVTMNFILAWVLISLVLMSGFPQQVDPKTPVSGNRDIQISEVLPNTPAEAMGLRFGDKILSIGDKRAMSVTQVQDYITTHKGMEISLRVARGTEEMTLQGTPRVNYPDNEGSLGIGLGETEIVNYAWYESIWEGAKATYHLTGAMLSGIYGILKGLVTGTHEGLSSVSGPVGIAKLTGQVSDLGFVYLLYFAAILSINLGIINILPIPALDGGRILFILIELIKGAPVSQKVEGMFHQIGFALLLLLMVWVTVHDFSKFHIFGNLFG